MAYFAGLDVSVKETSIYPEHQACWLLRLEAVTPICTRNNFAPRR